MLSIRKICKWGCPSLSKKLNIEMGSTIAQRENIDREGAALKGIRRVIAFAGKPIRG
jgi:hypothetical protein